MHTQDDKTTAVPGIPAAHSTSQKSREARPVFTDQRTIAVTQRKLNDIVNQSPQVRQLASMQQLAQGAVIQRVCGAPGCTDPFCFDTANHGFDRVMDLRAGPLYNWTSNPGDARGTGTSTGTRSYVNQPDSYYPQEIRTSYHSEGGGGFTEFGNAPLRSGQRADAGHIRGRQNGGLGDDNVGVFSQNPQQNRGNYLDGEPTRDIWRAHEDEQRRLRESGASVNTTVVLRDEPRFVYPHLPDGFNAQYDPPGYNEAEDADWTMTDATDDGLTSDDDDDM